MKIINLSNRKLKILYAIINNYIKTGEPISSKNLCDLLDFVVSPATVRNEMSELTDLGFLEQPHTSAARIPSCRGYRLYINHLMPKKHISDKNQLLIDNILNTNLKVFTPEEILCAASDALANISNFVVISTIFKSKTSTVKNIQLIKTSRSTIMLILTTSAGVVRSKIFKCDLEITQDLLNLLHNTLNQKFSGVSLTDITPGFIQSVAASLGEFYLLIPNALLATLEAVKDVLKNNVHICGQTNLLLLPEFSFNALKIMQRLNCPDYTENLLSNFSPNTTTISIGKENLYEEFYNTSIIKTNLCFNNKIIGSIGIITPIRVDYSTLIANIEYVAASISRLLGNVLDF